MKRNDYIDWDTYFMGVAQLSSMRSKDPKTQVGACIVNSNNKIIGIGYNGFPKGCSDDEFPWEKSDILDESKHAYVVHAELNAILNSIENLNNCILYVTLFPCNECTKAIIQSGIKKIVYLDDKNRDKDYIKATKRMLDAVNIEYVKLNSYKLKINNGD